MARSSASEDGTSSFYDLLFGRDWPSFYAFDLLEIDGEDVRERSLLERKRRLKAILRKTSSRLLSCGCACPANSTKRFS